MTPNLIPLLPSLQPVVEGIPDRRKSIRSLGPADRLSVVIPCFNEQDVLPLLFQQVQEALEPITENYEILVVDDGSTDLSWPLLEEQHERDERWKAVRLARNFGHQVALWHGLSMSTGRIVLVLDADLQDPPELIADFLEQWAVGYDVVYAVRQSRPESPGKRLAYHLYYRLLSSVAEIDIPLDAGDFCLLDCRVLEAMKAAGEPGTFIRGLRAWVGFPQVGLPYQRRARAAGQVKYTLPKLAQLAISGLIGFSNKPLRLASWLGLGTMAGCAVSLPILALLVKAAPITYLATGLFFLGGVQLFCLGILGEYVGRIYDAVRNRPTAIVQEQIGIKG